MTIGQGKKRAGVPPEGRLASEALEATNKKALARRFFLQPGYGFSPATVHDRTFHEAKARQPYFGYVDVEVEGVPPFAMLSNNDDQVAQVYFWYGPDAFESLSLRLWRELARRSEHVLDVGAFTGVYSLVAAKANPGAEIYSFEPMKRTFGRLVANLRVNRLGRRVRAFDLALGDQDGPAAMHTFHGHLNMDSGSSLIAKSGKEVASREPVETRRLDALLEEQDIAGADLIKVDVEQAEKLVLAGMRETLRVHRPHLLVEVLSEENLRDLDVELGPLGYNFAVIEDLAQSFHVNDFGALGGAYNVLFAPVSAGELRGFCSSVEPLPPGRLAEDVARRYHRPDYPVENRRLRRRARDAEERERRLRREMEAMRASRGWKVASALNAAASRMVGVFGRA